VMVSKFIAKLNKKIIIGALVVLLMVGVAITYAVLKIDFWPDEAVMYYAPLPNYSNAVYMSSEEPIKGNAVWFIVGPNGIPGEEGSFTNFAGFQVWRSDPSLPESYADLEWLEITSGSPCFKTDDFVIATARFGEGKCYDLVFGSMRTDTNEKQKAFRINSTEGRDIYTSFTKDIEILEAFVTGDSSTIGLFGNEPVVQQLHIDDADGTLEDLTLRFNALLDALEAYGLLEGGE